MRKLLRTLSLMVCLLAPVHAETLRLSTVNWEPVYGESLPENGFFSALSREAFKRAGYDTEFSFVPWKRALEGAKSGYYDGMLGAYFTEERTQYFEYTDVIYNVEEIFITLKDRSINYKVLNDLKDYRIGGLAGAAPITELTEKGFMTQPATHESDSLLKLAIGRIDVMVMGKARFYYDIENDARLKKYKDNFETLSPPFKRFEMYCPINKNKPNAKEIVSRFNKALKEMKADGTYAAILNRFNQR